jgi:exodeoxyribonuclease VII large subunit
MHLGAHLRQHSPALRVSAAGAQLNAGHAAMKTAMERRLQSLRHRLSVAAGTLDVVSPLATLRRGYAIVSDAAGHVVADASALQPGDELHARLARGAVQVRVERAFTQDSGADSK